MLAASKTTRLLLPFQPIDQLFFGQGWFEVEDDVHALAVVEGPDGAAAQVVGDPAFQTVAGEIEVSLVAFDQCAVHIQVQSHILHFQAREGRIIVFRHERRLARENRRDSMPRLFREAVAVAGRARHGIGFSARGDDHRRKAVEIRKMPDGRAVSHIDAQFADPPLQGAGHVARHQRSGIHPLPLQRDGRHAERLEEADDIVV